MLQTFGFKDDDEFYAAVELTDWKVAYNKFSNIMDLLASKSVEGIAIRQGLKDAGFWDEKDHNTDGIAMWNIARAAAPKHAQLLDLTAELGLKVPHSWSM